MPFFRFPAISPPAYAACLYASCIFADRSRSYVRTQDAAAMCTHREAFPGLLRAGGMAMFACRGHSTACGQDAADETIDGGI